MQEYLDACFISLLRRKPRHKARTKVLLRNDISVLSAVVLGRNFLKKNKVYDSIGIRKFKWESGL